MLAQRTNKLHSYLSVTEEQYRHLPVYRQFFVTPRDAGTLAHTSPLSFHGVLCTSLFVPEVAGLSSYGVPESPWDKGFTSREQVPSLQWGDPEVCCR